MEKKLLLSAKDIEIEFTLRGKVLKAIRKCSLDIYEGETVAIVGESGSGKSVFTKSFLGMLDANGSITGGSILYDGTDISKYKTEKEWMTIRGKKIAMVMQDPMTSLNPLKKIGKQIQESIELNQGIKGPEAKRLAVEMLAKVGIPDPERRANQYIWEDHALSVAYPSPEELEKLDYRSKKALAGQVRIVSWPGADCCACCGTHVLRSGQVGLVKLLSCQKFREGVRIEMAAGARALDRFNVIAGQNTRVSQLLSAKPDATAAAVERLQAELYALRGRVAALEERDFARLARQYQGAGDVLLVEPAMSPESLRKLCGAVQNAAGGRCAVFAGGEGAFQYAVSAPEGDLRPLAKSINAALNGRGGGKPNFVQGSVQAEEGEIARFFSALA